ncbi:MAG: hypothetical protein HQ591_10105 [candidate division Zixibacteria bacterium]|nr:hypothetical protein [Candidatus Tariuqbacter arcticus]
MLKTGDIIIGFFGGLAGMVPLMLEGNGIKEYIAAFTFAFILSMLGRDYFRELRRHNDRDRMCSADYEDVENV